MIPTAAKSIDIKNNLLVSWYTPNNHFNIDHFPLSRRIMLKVRATPKHKPIVTVLNSIDDNNDTSSDPHLDATARVAKLAAEFVLDIDDDF